MLVLPVSKDAYSVYCVASVEFSNTGWCWLRLKDGHQVTVREPEDMLYLRNWVDSQAVKLEIPKPKATSQVPVLGGDRPDLVKFRGI